jgi:hypothetical protein
MDEHAVLLRARQVAERDHPEDSAYKHAAFANAVQAAVTGWSGGYGGPSVREHAAGRTYRDGSLTFDEAVELLGDPDGLIFGPLQPIHDQCWAEEYCFDDDPDDVAELERRKIIGPN